MSIACPIMTNNTNGHDLLKIFAYIISLYMSMVSVWVNNGHVFCTGEMMVMVCWRVLLTLSACACPLFLCRKNNEHGLLLHVQVHCFCVGETMHVHCFFLGQIMDMVCSRFGFAVRCLFKAKLEFCGGPSKRFASLGMKGTKLSVPP